MAIYKHCYCIKCNKKLSNIDDRDNQVQPQDGVAFITYGHYGSTFFDPCNGDYMQIVVCDECLKALDKKKKLVYNTSNDQES
jgi:hypothetical protein